MKHIVSIVCSLIIFISCTKQHPLQPGSPAIKLDASNDTIFGKWDLVSDSSSTGVGINNHTTAYAGQPGDYFDFRADNHLYIKEGATMDTLSYTALTDSTIIISTFGIIVNGIPDTTHIINLSVSHAILNAPEIITPGGEFHRKVELNR